MNCRFKRHPTIAEQLMLLFKQNLQLLFKDALCKGSMLNNDYYLINLGFCDEPPIRSTFWNPKHDGALGLLI